MALSAAERQRRCRSKRKDNAERYQEYFRKARESYHAKKRLVQDMGEKNDWPTENGELNRRNAELYLKNKRDLVVKIFYHQPFHLLRL